MCGHGNCSSQLGLAVAGAVALLPLWVVFGCASEGQPRPPSLQLPVLAENLTAERSGDRVALAWTTSANSTDGDRIKGAITAVVCLDTAPNATATPPPTSRRTAKRGQKEAISGTTAGAPAVPCHAVGRFGAIPGQSRAEVTMDAALAAGPARLLAYRIELENQKGRSAGTSTAVFVGGGAAPAAAGPLRVSARREGATVEWKPAASTGAAMEVRRTLIATAEGPVEAKPAAGAKPGPAPGKAPAAFAPGAPKAPAREVVLRADGDGGVDAGGMLDRTVRDGDTYTYAAQRVATVTIGKQTLEVRGSASPAATFTYRAVFPPKPPTRLVLVPGGGFGEPPAIDLSWDANLETDVLGYNVYRSESGGTFVRVNEELLPAPVYRDLHVEAGHRYTYRVTAVDLRHNESAAGAEVAETLR